MSCDLHTHTNHSDGSSTVQELILGAKENNLIIALTDHNTVTGLAEFLSLAEREGITAIGGSELSTEHEGKEFHLIGLFISPEHYERVESLCAEFVELKEFSNIDLCRKLADKGMVIDYQAVKARNIKGNANRAHIAAELVSKGYFSSVKDAFSQVLDEKLGLYVPPKRLQLIDAIRFLRQIDALPVLAHPLKEVSADRLRQMLPALIDAGLVAIETMHSSYSDEDIAEAKKIVKDLGILESGGSDYHGDIKPGVALGCGKGSLDIPDEVYFALLRKHAELLEGGDE